MPRSPSFDPSPSQTPCVEVRGGQGRREAGHGGGGWGLGGLFGAKALRTRAYLFPDEKVFPRSIKTQGLKIHQRFHFASALKRMSVLASYEKLGSTDLCYIAAVKGAPETLHSMVSQPRPGSGGGSRAVGDLPLRSLQFAQCPPDYHHIHTEISREGARVLALGYKELGHLTHQQVRAQAPPHPNSPCGSPFTHCGATTSDGGNFIVFLPDLYLWRPQVALHLRFLLLPSMPPLLRDPIPSPNPGLLREDTPRSHLLCSHPP